MKPDTDLEVVDQTLHALLHHSTGWWCELMIVNLDNTSGHLVKTLANDSQTLSHLLDTAEVAVVAVTVLANRDIEFDLWGKEISIDSFQRQ